jgi:hypothetical protein
VVFDGDVDPVQTDEMNSQRKAETTLQKQLIIASIVAMQSIFLFEDVLVLHAASAETTVEWYQ